MIVSEVFVVAAKRTPMGKFGGVFAEVSAVDLGTAVIRSLVSSRRVSWKKVEMVIMGNVLATGLGQNPARQAALGAGLDEGVTAFGVSLVCGSAMEAVILGMQAIRAERANLVIAGGMENMSRAPYVASGARFGLRLGKGELVDSMLVDGLVAVDTGKYMGVLGDYVATKNGVTRRQADWFSLKSHRLAAAARDKGWFDGEIVEVALANGKTVGRDEGIRDDTSFYKLEKLKPAFGRRGVVTAGNASQISDGAAGVMLMSGAMMRRRRIKPLARIVDYVVVGVAGKEMMEAPILAVEKLLAKTGMEMDEVDLVEHNEAFASASVVVRKKLGIKRNRFNVCGGAVALGHPLGASGARILVTLLHSLKRMKKKVGIATLCVGGGNGMAMLVENLE